jgi:hypothetical protein
MIIAQLVEIQAILAKVIRVDDVKIIILTRSNDKCIVLFLAKKMKK